MYLSGKPLVNISRNGYDIRPSDIPANTLTSFAFQQNMAGPFLSNPSVANLYAQHARTGTMFQGQLDRLPQPSLQALFHNDAIDDRFVWRVIRSRRQRAKHAGVDVPAARRQTQRSPIGEIAVAVDDRIEAGRVDVAGHSDGAAFVGGVGDPVDEARRAVEVGGGREGEAAVVVQGHGPAHGGHRHARVQRRADARADLRRHPARSRRPDHPRRRCLRRRDRRGRPEPGPQIGRAHV